MGERGGATEIEGETDTGNEREEIGEKEMGRRVKEEGKWEERRSEGGGRNEGERGRMSEKH